MTNLERIGAVVDGQVVDHEDYFAVLDPATGEQIALVGRCSPADVDAAVRAARRAATEGPWPTMAPKDRARILRRLSDLILEHRAEFADIESRDTGKPISQARTDVDVAARYFEFYAGAIESLHGDSIPAIPGTLVYTLREPLGVTAHIEPWNYPLQIGCRTLAPALAMGNCCVLKPAEEAPLSLLRLGSLALEAGLPTGVLNVVTGIGAEAGAALASHPDIDHLSFTGSVEVGALVAAAAARNVKPVALELGGKSPNIVLADADITSLIPVVARSVLQNAGQTCSAGSRLLVHRSVHDEVVDGIIERFALVRLGRGTEDPDLGPLISRQQLDQVEAAVQRGADTGTLRFGGRPAKVAGFEDGYFFEPTLIDDADPAGELAQSEIFGPVLVVSTFDTEDEAIQLANGTPYGLIAAVWTTDVARAHRMASRLQCGQVYVNGYGAGGGVELPFGGVKKSGYGREKGAEALLAFCQTKTVAVRFATP